MCMFLQITYSKVNPYYLIPFGPCGVFFHKFLLPRYLLPHSFQIYFLVFPSIHKTIASIYLKTLKTHDLIHLAVYFDLKTNLFKGQMECRSMVHKKKTNQEKESISYSIEDVMKIAEDIFSLSKENEYNPGAFVHGLIFALEATQKSYNIPQQQLANIKRGCRRYFREVTNSKKL